MRGTVIALLWTLAGAGPMPAAAPPDFWLAPQAYEVGVARPILLGLRTGQQFSGAPPLNPAAGLRRCELIWGDQSIPLEMAQELDAAIRFSVPAEGLAVVVQESAGEVVTWDDWAAFRAFAIEWGFPWALDDHHSRNLPRTGFRQSDLRFAKTLIAVGSGAGADRATGMEAEIVALANPYTQALADGLPVQLLYQGKPRKSARVRVHARHADGRIETEELITDMDGRAVVAVAPATEYLLDAVMLRPLAGNAENGQPVWQSLSASLTFRTPG